MNSATWQMTSTHPGEKARLAGPTNRLLWKFNRQRLSFEELRDSLVAVTGQLDSRLGGNPVNILSGFNVRRSIYGRINRMDVDPVLRAFDFPDPNITCVRREVTTVAPQALFLMNNSFTIESAKRILQRKNLPADATARIGKLFQFLFTRSPHDDELKIAYEFLGNKPTLVHWENFIQALLLTNEFAFID